ncbi:hypothetical protein D6829_02200 [Candidatus Pacearchaeota archaeon]|nr:MAG: hypothetical protein D6829_02200 [Candidatus Pacearchaeota archaeon]
MILVVRIAGKVAQKKRDIETMNRLKIRKKFSATVIDEKDKVRMGMVHSVKHCVAFGKVKEDFLKKMEKRKKGDVYFLHPPRGGLKSAKDPYPKGVLGEHKDITNLVGRML